MRKKGLIGVGIGLVVFATLVVCGQLPPSTLPSTPGRIAFVRAPGIDGAEFRKFRFGGKDCCAVLNHQDIKLGPEWSPSLALPLNLGGVEAAARAELNRVITDAPEWEITNIQLSRLSDETGKRWYYVITFNPMLKPGGVAIGDIVVMLTIDGKPGRISKI